MSFTSLFPAGGVAGDPFPVDYPALVSDLNKIADNFDDHETSIGALETADTAMDTRVDALELNAVHNIRTRFSAAQVNAGATILAGVASLKYRLVDITLIAIGGSASGATDVRILATQSAGSVVLIAAAVAALTQSTVVKPNSANVTVLADGASFIQNDANTALTIGKTGGSLATATHIDVILTYELKA